MLLWTLGCISSSELISRDSLFRFLKIVSISAQILHLLDLLCVSPRNITHWVHTSLIWLFVLYLHIFYLKSLKCLKIISELLEIGKLWFGNQEIKVLIPLLSLMTVWPWTNHIFIWEVGSTHILNKEMSNLLCLIHFVFS